MPWKILFHEDFDREFQGFHHKVQDEILASLLVLQREGPNLVRVADRRFAGHLAD